MEIKTTDPAYHTLEKDLMYDLCGLINSQHEIAQCAYNSGIIFRLSLRLGTQMLYSTAIIEVINTKRAMMPKTPPDFSKSIQLAYIKNCVYVGEKKIDHIIFYNFKVTIDDVQDRFIWFSAPRPDFWTNPTRRNSDDLQPILESASGSVFGVAVKPEKRLLFQSQLIGGVHWEDWRLEVEELKNDLRRPETDFLHDGKLIFEATFDSPPMHM